jgi:Putative zinc-finger
MQAWRSRPFRPSEHNPAAYVLGDLTDDYRARFEQHLPTCGACKYQVTVGKALLSIFTQALIEPTFPRARVRLALSFAAWLGISMLDELTDWLHSERTSTKQRSSVQPAIRDYLLGKLDDDEFEAQTNLSVLMLWQDEFLETVAMVEDQIIEDYMNGALTPDDKDAFEEHFLVAPERKQKLQSARFLRTRH